MSTLKRKKDQKTKKKSKKNKTEQKVLDTFFEKKVNIPDYNKKKEKLFSKTQLEIESERKKNELREKEKNDFIMKENRKLIKKKITPLLTNSSLNYVRIDGTELEETSTYQLTQISNKNVNDFDNYLIERMKDSFGLKAPAFKKILDTRLDNIGKDFYGFHPGFFIFFSNSSAIRDILSFQDLMNLSRVSKFFLKLVKFDSEEKFKFSTTKCLDLYLENEKTVIEESFFTDKKKKDKFSVDKEKVEPSQTPHNKHTRNYVRKYKKSILKKAEIKILENVHFYGKTVYFCNKSLFSRLVDYYPKNKCKFVQDSFGSTMALYFKSSSQIFCMHNNRTPEGQIIYHKPISESVDVRSSCYHSNKKSNHNKIECDCGANVSDYPFVDTKGMFTLKDIFLKCSTLKSQNSDGYGHNFIESSGTEASFFCSRCFLNSVTEIVCYVCGSEDVCKCQICPTCGKSISEIISECECTLIDSDTLDLSAIQKINGNRKTSTSRKSLIDDNIKLLNIYELSDDDSGSYCSNSSEYSSEMSDSISFSDSSEIDMEYERAYTLKNNPVLHYNDDEDYSESVDSHEG